MIISTSLLECVDNKCVCSDDGPDPFGITREFAPQFPMLDDPSNSSAECQLASWSACIQADAANHGMSITFSGAIYFPDGASRLDTNLNTRGVDFLSAGRDLVFDTAIVDCSANMAGGQKDGFRHLPGVPGTLEVNGPLGFRGYNLTFKQPVDPLAQTYRDRETKQSATIVVEKDGSGLGATSTSMPTCASRRLPAPLATQTTCSPSSRRMTSSR